MKMNKKLSSRLSPDDLDEINTLRSGRELDLACPLRLRRHYGRWHVS
jgi:hypothetical protein